ncbi:MAG: hypothetical protein ACEQSR_05385 [Candidatus Methylacidiphilales bacterium]
MVKNCLIAILLLIVLVACRNEGFQVNIQTNGKIVLIDSTLLTNNFESYNPEYMQSGYFPVYYIGKKADTFYLKREPFKYDDYLYLDKKMEIYLANENNISIRVDTNFKTSIDLTYKHYDSNDDLAKIDSFYCNAAFPFFIENLSDSLICVGEGKMGLHYMYLQAINAKGNWVDIEKPFKISCGNGYQSIVLAPKQLLLGKLMRKRGEHKAICRLKLKYRNNIIYSNIFEDWIDKRMFTIDFDSNYME